MNLFTLPLNGGVKNLMERIHDFYFSPCYPFFVAFMTLIFYINQWAILGLLFFALSASICFLFFRDVTPIMPLLVMVVMIFNDYDVMNGILPYVCLAPAVITFIARFFIYPSKNIRLNSHFFSLLAVTVAMLTAGLFSSENDYLQGLVSSMTLGPVMIIIYLFFRSYIEPKNNGEFKKYFCFTLLAAGIVVALSLLYYFWHAIIIDDDRIKYYYEIGWANTNGLATFLCLSIPACFYLMSDSNRSLLFLPLLVLLYAGVMVTKSDGVLLLICLATPIMLFFAIFKKFTARKHSYTAVLIISLIIVAFVYLLVYEVINLPFINTQRKDLFNMATEWFDKSPIFGEGLGHLLIDKQKPGPYQQLRNFNFHSTYYHVLATMGIVGIIAYFIYFVSRISILTKKQTLFNMFMLIAFLLFECYGMVDTAEFNAIPLMSTLTLLIIAVDVANEKADKELPLSA